MKLFRITILFLLKLLHAFPVQNDIYSTSDRTHQGVPTSPDVFSTIEYMAAFSKIAYCIPHIKKTGSLPEICPEMEFCKRQPNTEVLDVHRQPFFKSGLYFIGVDHEKKWVVLSFKGTSTVGDWNANRKYRTDKYEQLVGLYGSDKTSSTSNLFNGALVHHGFNKSFRKIFNGIPETVRPYVDIGYQLYITGHSLGGAYAYLASLEFRQLGYSPIGISYSQPRVGNLPMNEAFDTLFKTNEAAAIVLNGGTLPAPSFSRVVQSRDPVPCLPPIHQGQNAATYSHAGLDFRVNKTLPHSGKDILFYGSSNRTDLMLNSFDYRIPDRVFTADAKSALHSMITTVISEPCIDGYYDDDYEGIYDKSWREISEWIDNFLRERKQFVKEFEYSPAVALERFHFALKEYVNSL